MSTTERQARDGVWLEAQAAKTRAMAEEQDATLERVIEDAGESGKNLRRKGLVELWLSGCASSPPWIKADGAAQSPKPLGIPLNSRSVIERVRKP